MDNWEWVTAATAASVDRIGVSLRLSRDKRSDYRDAGQTESLGIKLLQTGSVSFSFFSRSVNISIYLLDMRLQQYRITFRTLSLYSYMSRVLARNPDILASALDRDWDASTQGTPKMCVNGLWGPFLREVFGLGVSTGVCGFSRT